MKVDVLARDVVVDGVVLLRLGGSTRLPAWAPGAHITLILGGGLERQYSLCGDPADRTAFEVAVLREPGGRGGSAWVHDKLEVGRSITVRGPRNNFPLVDAKAYTFIAGGIGITPLLPMLRAVDGKSRPWRLVYGGRTRHCMAFVDELGRFGDRIEVCPEDEVGLLDIGTAIAGSQPGTAVYACGPEPMLRAVEAACAAAPNVTLHLERFAPRERASDVTGGAFEVELSSSKRALSIGPDQNLLDELITAGVPMEFSCHEGTCGTCETRVLAGTVDHRDSLLTESEKAANDVMFPCVSRSAGSRLVLDL